MFFKLAAVAILDLEDKMALKHKKCHVIIFLMPELVEINILFAIFGHLVQEIHFIMFFKMASAAILDLEVKVTLSYKVFHSIMFLIPQLVGIDILFAIFGHLVQEIFFFWFFKMAAVAILKNGLYNNFPAILGRCMGAHFLKYRLRLLNPLRNFGILKWSRNLWKWLYYYPS